MRAIPEFVPQAWEIDLINKVHEREQREYLQIPEHEYPRNYEGHVLNIGEEKKNGNDRG